MTLTVSVADMPFAPSIVNVHVGPAPTGVTVNLLPDCEIVATVAGHVVPTSEKVVLDVCEAVEDCA